MAYTQEERDSAKKKFGTTSFAKAPGGGYTAEQRATANKPEEKIFSGGFVSDVFDVLQIPQFAATGALTPGVSITEAVRKRISPSKALKLKGISGFVVDVLFDPINFIGGAGLLKGASKLRKAGTGAKTLGAAVEAGEKGLITGRLNPFASEGTSLLKSIGLGGAEKKIAQKATQYTDTLKGVFKRDTGETVFDALKKTRPLDEIEQAAKTKFFTKDIVKGATRAEKVSDAEAMNLLKPHINRFGKAVKKGTAKAEDGVIIFGKLTDAAGYGSKKLSKEGHIFYKTLKKITDDAGVVWEKAGGTVLKGKQVPATLLKEFKKTNKADVDFLAEATKLGKKVKQENLAEYVGLKRGSELIPVQHTKGIKSATAIAKGKKAVDFKRIGERYFTEETHGVIKQIEGRLKTAQDRINTLNIESLTTTKTKRINDAITSELEKMRVMRDDMARLMKEGYERKGMSPLDINKALVKAEQKAIFNSDPAEAAYAKLLAVGKLQAKNKYLKKITELPSDIAVVADKASDIPKGFERLNLPGMKDMAVHKDAKPILEATFKKFSNIEEVERFLAGFDKIQNLWKGTATYLNIGFHTRNFVSNQWQLFLADAFNPVKVVKDLKVMRKVKKLRGQGKSIDDIAKALGGKEGKRYAEFANEALTGTGRFGADIEKTLKGQNWAFEAGGYLGELLEDSSKYTLFKNRINDGYNVAEAARDTRKFMFDYQDITDLERNVFKRIMPFYTWSRNNVPLQVGMLIQNPGKFGVIPKAKRMIESMVDGEPMDENLLPAWMRDGYSVFLGENPEGLKGYMNTEGFLPALDIAKVGRPQELVGELISPFIKTPIEMVSNYNFFYEKQMDEYARTNVLGMDMPFLSSPKGRKIIDMIRPIKEVERVLGLDSVGAKMSVSDRLLKLLGGVNMKRYDENKQADIFDMVLNNEVNKLKKLEKKARKGGEADKADGFKEMMNLIKSGEKEIKL